jgi:DNA-binding transcriptional regulator YiaG
MTHAYNEKYLSNAVSVFSEMIDYAVNDLKIDGDEFLRMFIISGAAKQFERGNPRYVAGRSGIEIANEVIEKVKDERPSAESSFKESKTPEYWAGWALSQYQWETAKPFEAILRYLTFATIVKMYPVLHEADITKFIEVADSVAAKQNAPTNLKRIRSAAGITQDKLAAESGVSLRSIQMYEQRNKDINKAQAISLTRIAHVLGCETEDLLEI